MKRKTPLKRMIAVVLAVVIIALTGTAAVVSARESKIDPELLLHMEQTTEPIPILVYWSGAPAISYENMNRYEKDPSLVLLKMQDTDMLSCWKHLNGIERVDVASFSEDEIRSFRAKESMGIAFLAKHLCAIDTFYPFNEERYHRFGSLFSTLDGLYPIYCFAAVQHGTATPDQILELAKYDEVSRISYVDLNPIPLDEPDESASATWKLGDVNGDGKITAADARIALRVSAKLASIDPLSQGLIDLDGDGKVTAAEARTILRVSARLETL